MGRKRIESGTLKPGSHRTTLQIVCMHTEKAKCVSGLTSHTCSTVVDVLSVWDKEYTAHVILALVSQQADPDTPLQVMFGNLIENKHQYDP